MPGTRFKSLPRTLRVSGSALTVVFFVSFLVGCGLNSSKKQYVLAEKLWIDGKYKPAVTEFEKVYSRDPRGQLGQQALFRAAMTQAYFLSEYPEAVKKFRTYSQVAHEPESVWEAQKQVGELLFTKLEQYEAAAQHYQTLLRKKPAHPEDDPFFEFRIAKSYFYLWKFADALQVYRALQKDYPGSAYAEKAALEVGATYFTRGEQLQEKGTESYQEAIDAYREFLKKYPRSDLLPQAKFGIASCLEEMDQLDAAYNAYEELRSTYPSPKVIEIKLARIRERKAQRSR